MVKEFHLRPVHIIANRQYGVRHHSLLIHRIGLVGVAYFQRIVEHKIFLLHTCVEQIYFAVFLTQEPNVIDHCQIILTLVHPQVGLSLLHHFFISQSVLVKMTT